MRQTILCIVAYSNIKGTGEPAHMRSLVGTLTIRLYQYGTLLCPRSGGGGGAGPWPL